MIHKCYFLGLVALIFIKSGNSILKYCPRNKGKDDRKDSHILSESFILVSFIALYTTPCWGKCHYYHIKTYIFYRPDSFFSKASYLILIGDQQEETNSRYSRSRQYICKLQYCNIYYK